MKADPRFRGRDEAFWAYVRALSEKVGYTDGSDENGKKVLAPTSQEIHSALVNLGLDTSEVEGPNGPTALGAALVEYFAYRANALNGVRSQFMCADAARGFFAEVRKTVGFEIHFPMNKQKGEKKKPAYLTGSVIALLEEELERIEPLRSLHVAADETGAHLDWKTKEALRDLGPKAFVDCLVEKSLIRRAKRGSAWVYHPGDVQRHKLHWLRAKNSDGIHKESSPVQNPGSQG